MIPIKDAPRFQKPEGVVFVLPNGAMASPTVVSEPRGRLIASLTSL